MEQRLRTRSPMLLACDFDGTLAPIVARPEEAQLPDETRVLLRRLVESKKLLVAMVSGRSLADVRHRVGIEGIVYCGNHGLEIDGPGINWSSAEGHAHRPQLADAVCTLRRQTTGIKGVIIEDKGLTATVHWRLVADESRDELRELVAAAVQSRPGLRLAYGKAVWELRPRIDWNKGAAILLMLKRAGINTADTICLGDDDTDESSFRALPDGITLRVGNSNRTAARYLLDDVADTADFLFCVLNARLADWNTVVPDYLPLSSRTLINP